MNVARFSSTSNESMVSVRKIAFVSLVAAVSAAAQGGGGGGGSGGGNGGSGDSSAFFRALDLEAAGKYREAAALFRASLRTPNAVGAMLGLERVRAELGRSDSLITPLDSLIAERPRESVYR